MSETIIVVIIVGVFNMATQLILRWMSNCEHRETPRRTADELVKRMNGNGPQ